MISARLIPILLLHKSGLVKSKQFKNYTYIGDPINAVKIFNEKEVDEICLLDIDASKIGKDPDYRLIEEIAAEAFIPFAYGGGIRNLDQAKTILKIGAEKVVLNTEAIRNPKLVAQIAEFVGSQSMVVSIDIKKNIWGSYKVYSHVNKKTLSIDPFKLIKDMIELGAGEIILNSVDHDGMMAGMDLKLIKQFTSGTSIPIIAAGGAATLIHCKEALSAGASAVAAGSMFVFHGKHKAVLINYPDRKKLIQIFN